MTLLTHGPTRRSTRCRLASGTLLLAALAAPATAGAGKPIYRGWTLKQLVQSSAVIAVVNRATPPLITRTVKLRLPNRPRLLAVKQTYYRFQVVEVLYNRERMEGRAAGPAPGAIIEVEPAFAYQQHLLAHDKRGRHKSPVRASYGAPSRGSVPTVDKCILFVERADQGTYTLMVNGAYETLAAKPMVLRTIRWVEKHPTAPIHLP